MSSIGSISSRTTTMLNSDSLLSALRRTNADLLDVQEAITTGLDIRKPSDDPAKTTAILSMLRQIESRDQHEENLAFAYNVLDMTDIAIADATTLINEAHTIALDMVNTVYDEDTRAQQAAIIDQKIRSLVDIANRQHLGVSLFGGDSGGQPFEFFLGGVRYSGSREQRHGDVGLMDPLAINTTGSDSFNALSSRVESQIDLDPDATAQTRLADLTGADNRGIRKGSVVVSVAGFPQQMVDLSDADTLGNVVARINAAIDPAIGEVRVTNTGLILESFAPPGTTITISDPLGGHAAKDLGIDTSATGAAVIGADLDPKVTADTTLASFGPAIDLTSGLKITQGSHTKVVDFSTADTVQDMMNMIKELDLGLRMEINDNGTALNLVSEVSGINLSIGENGGGTTATDLGLRTFDLSTNLADLSFGKGVEIKKGEDDFRITLNHGGAFDFTFDVNLDGAVTIGDVIGKISDAATAVGMLVGQPGDLATDFNIGLASDGNGLVMEDGTGPGGFWIESLNESHAAYDLGLTLGTDIDVKTTSNTLTSKDVAQVRAESVFTHLMELSAALKNKDDNSGITFAASALENDVQDLTTVRAANGVRSQRVTEQQDRSAEMKITEQIMLSDLRDTDLTEAITRFTQLQQQLTASFRVGAAQMQLSFLDFLR